MKKRENVLRTSQRNAKMCRRARWTLEVQKLEFPSVVVSRLTVRAKGWCWNFQLVMHRNPGLVSGPSEFHRRTPLRQMELYRGPLEKHEAGCSPWITGLGQRQPTTGGRINSVSQSSRCANPRRNAGKFAWRKENRNYRVQSSLQNFTTRWDGLSRRDSVSFEDPQVLIVIPRRLGTGAFTGLSELSRDLRHRYFSMYLFVNRSLFICRVVEVDALRDHFAT